VGHFGNCGNVSCHLNTKERKGLELKDLIVGSISVIIVVFSVFLKSQKHSIEKIFDSQAEKIKRRITYESIFVFVVIICSFFLIPITEFQNKKLYYVIYSISIVSFVLTQATEMLNVILKYKNRRLPKWIERYQENLFNFSIAQMIIYSITIITVNIHMYTLFYSIIKENKRVE